MKSLRTFIKTQIQILIILASFASAQPAGKESGSGQPGSMIPDSDIGKIAKEFIAVINSRDTAKAGLFAHRYLNTNLAGVGAERWDEKRYTVLLKNIIRDAGVITPVDLIRKCEENNGSGIYRKPRRYFAFTGNSRYEKKRSL